MEEEEEEGGRMSIFAVNGVRLRYKITVRDAEYTVEKLRADLVLATQEGRMNTILRFYAAQFGATGLTNATLSVPQVTNAAAQRDSSSQLTGVMIALLVIGIFIGILVTAIFVLLGLNLKPTPERPGAVQLELVL